MTAVCPRKIYCILIILDVESSTFYKIKVFECSMCCGRSF